VHPEDERYQSIIGKHVILPLVGRRIPIIADKYPDPEEGTGAVKMTPAHDFNDFDVGKRAGLANISILTIEAAIDLRENEAFLDGLEDTEELRTTIEALHGLDRFEARTRIVEMLEARGLVDKI